jgi:hypothetical protein
MVHLKHCAWIRSYNRHHMLYTVLVYNGVRIGFGQCDCDVCLTYADHIILNQMGMCVLFTYVTVSYTYVYDRTFTFT